MRALGRPGRRSLRTDPGRLARLVTATAIAFCAVILTQTGQAGAALEPSAAGRADVLSATGDRGESLAARGSAAVSVEALTEAIRAGRNPPFIAGLIISDDSFYNFQTMDQSDVEGFFESQLCTPEGDVPCLSVYTQTTRTVPAAPGHCARIPGRKAESASSIIVRIARACVINPQVLIVLLQKEQSLVTHPSAYGYLRATGYACPDTAACDAKYFGFFNQVYRAAWQFREYTLHPSEWRYRVGDVAIQYHPNLACGASVVNIRNQATANLYNYTPYQPNAETRAHPDGPAGPCSAYGNLNFSRLFYQWFGSPLAVTFPELFPSCLNFVDGKDCVPVRPLSGGA